jgi:hypothetical protein
MIKKRTLQEEIRPPVSPSPLPFFCFYTHSRFCGYSVNAIATIITASILNPFSLILVNYILRAFRFSSQAPPALSKLKSYCFASRPRPLPLVYILLIPCSLNLVRLLDKLDGPVHWSRSHNVFALRNVLDIRNLPDSCLTPENWESKSKGNSTFYLALLPPKIRAPFPILLKINLTFSETFSFDYDYQIYRTNTFVWVLIVTCYFLASSPIMHHASFENLE